MSQVQCPNCHFYKVETEMELIDLDSGKAIKVGCFTPTLLVLSLVAFLLSLYPLTAYSQDANRMFWFFPVSVAAFALFVILARREPTPTRQATLSNHTCSVCGYKWQHRSDWPLPPLKPLDPTAMAGLVEAERKKREAEEEHHRNMLASYDQLYGDDA